MNPNFNSPRSVMYFSSIKQGKRNIRLQNRPSMPQQEPTISSHKPAYPMMNSPSNLNPIVKQAQNRQSSRNANRNARSQVFTFSSSRRSYRPNSLTEQGIRLEKAERTSRKSQSFSTQNLAKSSILNENTVRKVRPNLSVRELKIMQPTVPTMPKQQQYLSFPLRKKATSVSYSTGNVSNASLNDIVTQVPKQSNQTSSLLNKDVQGEDEIWKDHLFQIFQGIKLIRNLPPPDQSQVQSKKLTLQKRPGYGNKKTIIFDLDETLVHCTNLSNASSPDVVLPVVFPSGEVVQAGINIRPYARDCLIEANKQFEVIVFTASHPCYANVVINHLDPTGNLVHHRLYRDNCVISSGMFIKDLRVITNRKLSEMVIIDNAVYSFAFQLENGIPIVPWYDNRNDVELLNLMDYFQELANAEDVRLVNSRTYKLSTFYEDYSKTLDPFK